MIYKSNCRLANKELAKKGQMRFNEKAKKEDIEHFEKEHNICLPRLYKEWLLETDGADLFLPAGVQIYGVTHKPIIDVNSPDRPGPEYIVIGALATGDPIVIKNKSQMVCIYNHEAGRIEEDEIYTDFLAFLNDLPNIVGIND